MSEAPDRSAPESVCWNGLVAASLALVTAHAAP